MRLQYGLLNATPLFVDAAFPKSLAALAVSREQVRLAMTILAIGAVHLIELFVHTLSVATLSDRLLYKFLTWTVLPQLIPSAVLTVNSIRVRPLC